VQSSPAYADLVLELPRVTVADRVAVALSIVAGGHGAAVLAGQGATTAALVVACAGVLAATHLTWTRSRRSPAWRLERCPDGSLQVRTGGGGAVPAVLGHGTRRVGTSVFLDLRFAIGGRTAGYRRWLTSWDVPVQVLRRWTVVLPSSGRAACS